MVPWQNLVRPGFTVWAKVIPNSSGARKPDPTTLSCAVLFKPAVIFSVIITCYYLLVTWQFPRKRLVSLKAGLRPGQDIVKTRLESVATSILTKTLIFGIHYLETLDKILLLQGEGSRNTAYGQKYRTL